jgi:hypothetical protein
MSFDNRQPPEYVTRQRYRGESGKKATPDDVAK